jgi:hypothetical protein
MRRGSCSSLVTTTDIDKTCREEFRLPKDTVPGRLLLSIHYYTPWQFVGLSEDASWGKMIPTWGSEADVRQLNELFDRLSEFCVRNDTPAFIGEFSMCSSKDAASSDRWTTSVFEAALEAEDGPGPVGYGVPLSRREPYAPSETLIQSVSVMKKSPAPSAEVNRRPASSNLTT